MRTGRGQKNATAAAESRGSFCVDRNLQRLITFTLARMPTLASRRSNASMPATCLSALRPKTLQSLVGEAMLPAGRTEALSLKKGKFLGALIIFAESRAAAQSILFCGNVHR